MINDQVRKGIRVACAMDNKSLVTAATDSGVPKSAIYRYMSGSNDIYVTKLDKFCRLGLNRTLLQILELGRD